MAKDKGEFVVDETSLSAPVNGTNPAKSVRVRKDYGYEMSADEKYCLRVVLAARNACNLLADKIKRGNPISAEVLSACSTLSGEMGKITQQ